MSKKPRHPGHALMEILVARDITQAQLATHLGISYQRVNELVHQKRGVSAETAVLLSQALGQEPQFWMYLQADYDLATVAKPAKRVGRLK